MDTMEMMHQVLRLTFGFGALYAQDEWKVIPKLKSNVWGPS